MSLNIYFKELKRNSLNALVWIISLCTLMIFGMAFYPVLMEGDLIKQMTALFENPMMKGLMSAFGANIETMTSILGFYVTYGSIYMTLLGCLYSALYASNLVAKEEREKTAEFLLTKPVTRFEVIFSKFLAYFTYILLMNILLILSGFIGIEMFKGDETYNLNSFLVLSVYSSLLIFTFGGIGLFISLLLKRGKSTFGASMGIVIACYLIDSITKVTKEATNIGFISPFKFVDTNITNANYGFEWWRLLYLIALPCVLIIASFIIYRKKDILI